MSSDKGASERRPWNNSGMDNPSTPDADLHEAPSLHVSACPVVVVDDDPHIRELLGDYLGKNEMRVTALSNGRDLLSLFDTEAVDLVLLDVRLPGENGMMLAGALRQQARVPIMLVTGNAEEADRVMGLELERRRLRRQAVQPASCWRACGLLRRSQLQQRAQPRRPAPRVPLRGLGVQPAHAPPAGALMYKLELSNA